MDRDNFDRVISKILAEYGQDSLNEISKIYPNLVESGNDILEAMSDSGSLGKLFLESEDVGDEIDINEPFNPKDVNVQPKTMVLSNVLERLSDGAIVLDPDYQRNPNIWDNRKKSRLVESLLIKIPIPVFYFDMTEDEHLIVVDGLQRLVALKQFAVLSANDPEKLVLTDLEYLKDLNGKKYEELPILLQRRIRETEILTYLIKPGTPERVRNSIFERINTGGMTLEPAEIKNSVYRGIAADTLKELASSEEFKSATNNKISPDRMLDREYVNRFLAFYIIDLSEYKGNIEDYLNKILEMIKTMERSELQGYKEDFYKAMRAAYELFGHNAFKRLSNGRYTRLNKPLFEAVSVELAKLSQDNIVNLINRKDEFIKKYEKLFDDEEFVESISNGTAKKTSVEKRHESIKSIIMETIG